MRYYAKEPVKPLSAEEEKKRDAAHAALVADPPVDYTKTRGNCQNDAGSKAGTE
jgi:hypothetical protein